MLIVPPPPFRRAGGGGGGGWTGPTAFALGAPQSADVGAFSGTTLFPLPPNDSTGKYGIIFVSAWNPDSNPISIGTPSNWTLISSGTSLGNYDGGSGWYAVRTHLFGRRLTGSDLASLNVSFSGSGGGHAMAVMRVYDNVHATTPYERVSLIQDSTVSESSDIAIGDRVLDGPRRLAVVGIGMSGYLSTQPASGWTGVTGIPSDSYMYIDERNYATGPIPTQYKPVGSGGRDTEGFVKIELSLVPAT